MIFKKNSPKSPLISAWITAVYWIIATIGKHVVPQDALASRNKGIGVDESADGGVVIPGLQVIESGILGGELARRPLLPYPWFSI
jgi:hypothetical protein